MKPEYAIGAVILALVGIGLALLFMTPASLTTTKALIPNKGTLYVEIVSPSGFVNTPPITIGELVGKKVILIDFLTYSCINCQRTFPYINRWYEKYKDDGLEIIGIHTPEFAFEKDIKNVEEAMRRFGITHPIVLDNDYATWNAWGNRYWPRKYLIDINGTVVYDHIGEGAYEETEKKIIELLNDRKRVLGEDGMLGATAVESGTPNLSSVGSPETYFGASRNEYLGNGIAGTVGTQTLSLPVLPRSNTLYLGGAWDITPEYAEAADDTCTILYAYQAKNVYLVAEAAQSVVVEVWQDGVYIKDLHVMESGLYTVIENETPGPHTLMLRIEGVGLRAYTFTFG